MGLSLANKEMVAFVQKHNVESVTTLDTDTTLAETSKKDAEYCYKGFKAYQPVNVYWAEQELVLHTEFRDGNVAAGYEQLRIVKESLEMLPEGVQRVRIRSDAAGYQHDLMRYCEMGKNERFGRIEFAIGCIVSKEFKDAVREVRESEWQPIYRELRGEKAKTGRERAEICFVPNAIGHSKKDPEYLLFGDTRASRFNRDGVDRDRGATGVTLPDDEHAEEGIQVIWNSYEHGLGR